MGDQNHSTKVVTASLRVVMEVMDPTRATNKDTTPDMVATELRGVTTSSNKVTVGTTSNRATMLTNSRVSMVPSNRDMVVMVTTRATVSSKDTASNSKGTDNNNRDSSKLVSRGTARPKGRTGSNKDTGSSSRVRTANRATDSNSRGKVTRVTASKEDNNNRDSSSKLWEITASRTTPTTAQ